MLPFTIPPAIFNAMTSGTVWFTVIFCSLLIFIGLTCAYGKKKRYIEDSVCNRNCNLCLTDTLFMALVTILFALILTLMVQMGDRINKNCIDSAKADGAIIQMLGEHELSKKH